jgi:CheY-like chemotaxis protein
MMLSSADQHRDAMRCRELGLAAYMTKPIKQSELQNTMMAALGAVSHPHEPAGVSVPEPLAHAEHRPLQILVAEDSLVNQTLAVRLLERHGHTVVVVNNGVQALEALETKRFDVVLMDVQMPEMDGLQATERIREREHRTGAHMPIIAMTAHVMQGDRERCLEAGMDDYVAKPIQADVLFATLERQLPEGLVAASEPTPQIDVPTTDLFDKAATLRRVDGDRDLLREVVQLFREACTAILADIDGAIREQDATKLRQLAHTLKGEASNFEAAATVSAALRLEVMGREADLAHAQDAYADLQRALEHLLPALLAFGDEEESA